MKYLKHNFILILPFFLPPSFPIYPNFPHIYRYGLTITPSSDLRILQVPFCQKERTRKCVHSKVSVALCFFIQHLHRKRGLTRRNNGSSKEINHQWWNLRGLTQVSTIYLSLGSLLLCPSGHTWQWNDHSSHTDVYTWLQNLRHSQNARQ